MIFTALGLLVVAAGLLLAGIAKSSVALLMTSLLLTVGSGVVLASSSFSRSTMPRVPSRRSTSLTASPSATSSSCCSPS